jgi:formyl-CoA transferase
MTAPLSGLVVVAIEQAVAAPFCTARLADAGARVIKIERPEGDFARLYDDATPAGSSYFVWLNRGKQSMVLDLQQDEARRQLTAIIAQSDILVQNLKPGAMARLGLPISQLRQMNPGLICCSISGYGEGTVFTKRKAYDLLIQAESGLASITGGPDAPARVGISVVDIATGATAYSAILEALIARGRSGKGADIQVSMFGVIADWLTVPFLNAEAGNPTHRAGLSHPSIAPYGVFSTADGRDILISIQSEREWQVFCRDVLQMPGLCNDLRFISNIMRVKHRHETDDAISDIFAHTTSDTLIARLTLADIAFAELNNMSGLSTHPALRRMDIETEFGPVSLPASGVTLNDETDVRSFGRIPKIGEHTDMICADFPITPRH